MPGVRGAQGARRNAVTVTDRPRARWASGGRLFCTASIPAGKPGLAAGARQAGMVTTGRAPVMGGGRLSLPGL